MRLLLILLAASLASAAAPPPPLPDLAPLWNWSDAAASEATFRALQAEHRGDDALQVRTQVARALGLQGKFAEGHAELDAMADALGGASPVVSVRYYLERGRLHNSSGEPAVARPFFESAWERARSASLDGLAVDAAHMVGIVAPPPEGEAWTRKALDYASASDDPAAKRWRGSLLNNLASTLHDGGRFAEALPLFEEAVLVREAQGRGKSWFIARWSVGRCLRSLGRLDDALALQRALLADGHDGGYLQEELGELLLARGQPADAHPHFVAAHEQLGADPWLAKHEPARLARLAELAAADPAAGDEPPPHAARPLSPPSQAPATVRGHVGDHPSTRARPGPR